MKIRHIFPGLRAEPLASYLAGLGLFRVLGELADPDTTAAWAADGLAVTTTVEDVAAWLAASYVPTPVLSPWNNGSGFGAKDKEPLVRLEALRGHASPRLAQFREAIMIAEAVVRDARDQSWADDKKGLVLEFRNRCPEELLPWIDAAVVLAGDDPVFPPLLGTGGNDGRLDFSTNFHQSLLDVIDTPRSAAMAYDRIDVRECAEVRLAAEVEDWANRFSGNDSSAAVGDAARRFRKAHLEYTRDGGPRRLAVMLAELTSLELAVGRSSRAKENAPVPYAPPASRFLKELARDESPELRVAVGLASCASLGDRGTDLFLRHVLLPVDPNGQWRPSPVIPGFGARPLPQVLADVLIWRCRNAADHPERRSSAASPPSGRGFAFPPMTFTSSRQASLTRRGLTCC